MLPLLNPKMFSSAPNRMKRASAIEMIGNTPLVELRRLCPSGGRLFAKAEFVNPGGSVKDRAARMIIETAMTDGTLAAGQPVVEMTSGNMGAGLAVVCAVTGHPFVAVMSSGNSIERVRMLEALGAEVVLVDQVDGAAGQVTGPDIAAATRRAIDIAAERGGYYVDQFNNPSSIRAHLEGTGPELWRDLNGELAAFVACVGSGGTFVGTATCLKQMSAAVHCVAVEPEGCEVLAGKPLIKARHTLQGTGYGSVPPHWDPALVDGYAAVTDREAMQFKTRLAHEEGLYVGYSAAANVCAALQLIKSGALGPSPTVATVLCDTGLKY